MQQKSCWLFCLTLAYLTLATLTVSAATLSGTVYKGDGTGPVTGESVFIRAYTGIPCCTAVKAGEAGTNSTNGTYSISGLTAGTYFLRAEPSYFSAYRAEWFAGSTSAAHCHDAVSVTVTSSQTLSGANFQLDLQGGPLSLSGLVFQADGTTPVTYAYSNSVSVYTGDPCDSPLPISARGGRIAADGSYTLEGLESGSYYLKTSIGHDQNLIDAWWNSSGGSRDCSQAEAISLTEPGIVPHNFQLDPGGIIEGTLYKSDGTTPVTGSANAHQIHIYPAGDACKVSYGIKNVSINTSTGAYSIVGLEAGDYILRVEPYYYSNYLGEWWASPSSSRDCSQAQSVTVTEGATVSKVNFQLDEGSTLSGTVFQEDGTTPITGKSISIVVYDALPCDTHRSAKIGYVQSANGTFSIQGLAEGSYYLQAKPGAQVNYIPEWWAGTDSARDCSQAQAVSIGDGQNITGKNFQLDTGGTISGTVHGSDGVTPITDEYVFVSLRRGDPCGTNEYVDGTYIERGTGNFSFTGLVDGSYFLQAKAVYQSNFISEWWAAPASVRTCDQANRITVTEGNTHTGKNFQLDPGAVVCGILYESDGTTPLTNNSSTIYVFANKTCSDNSMDAFHEAQVNSETGTYAIFGLPDDSYLLKVENENNHIAEWWNSPLSVRQCSQAGVLAVTSPGVYTEKNFQLDPGATISGTVFERDGSTPVTVYGQGGMVVDVYTGDPCGSSRRLVTMASVMVDGSYQAMGLAPGSYYLLINENPFNMPETELLYREEWWRSGSSTRACSLAEPVTITGTEDIIDKNFQLDSVNYKFPWAMFIRPHN